MEFKLSDKLIIYIICLIIPLSSQLLIVNTAKGKPIKPGVSYESNKQISLAKNLIKKKRYDEAISFLEYSIATLPGNESIFPFLLLLTDGLIGTGDILRAQETLQQADTLSVTPSDEKAVLDRRKVLSKYPNTTYHSEQVLIDSQMVSTVVESEEKTWPLISNSFFETDLRQVLIDLSMETGISILWDATVQGLVTYEAVDLTLEDILKAILFPLGYTYTYKDGTYFVGSVNPGDPAFGLLSKTVVVTLSNIDAIEAANLLSDYFEPYVKASRLTNKICITAPPTLISRIRDDLEILDQPTDQILIEVIVTEISKDALREMGLDWSVTGLKDNPVWDLGVDNTNIESPGTIWNYSEMGLEFGDYTIDLVSSLEAMVQSGDATIRANPRITTINGRTAEISLTTDQYFIIQTSTSQTYQYNTLQSVTAGINLEITPYTAKTGEITVYVNPSVGDVVGKGANDLPEISTRSAKTSVRIMDGDTFTIGGLSLQSKKNVQNKVPFLGDIPLLGYLFRYDRVETKDTEIIIFITPHILVG